MKNKKKMSIYKFLIVLMSIFMFCACSKVGHKSALPTEEEIWMERFFEHLLLDNHGIYTLWGSKPMVRFEMCLYTDEELSQLQDEVEENVNVEKVIIEDYDFPENWGKWEKVRDQFEISQFLLFKKDNPDDPKLPLIFFVNIFETAFVIQENYPLFRKYIGEDFDSLEMVFELQRDSSKFWDVVFEKSELVGLLYGFGLKNSFGFNWKYRENKVNIQDFVNSLHFKFSNKIKNYGSATIDTVSLPVFAEFEEDSSMVYRYEGERKKIKTIYKNQNFVDCTLSRLIDSNKCQ